MGACLAGREWQRAAIYMHICIYIYIYVCVYIYIYIYLFIYVYIYIYIYIYMCIYFYLCAYTHLFFSASQAALLFADMRPGGVRPDTPACNAAIRSLAYIHIYIYIYIYIYRERERERCVYLLCIYIYIYTSLSMYTYGIYRSLAAGGRWADALAVLRGMPGSGVSPDVFS